MAATPAKTAPPGAAQPAAKGQSLTADAWKRLRKNRAAVVSLVFVSLTAIAGFCSPLISAHITHFSLDEQHTRLAFQPPGVADVSSDHPTYDGDASSFDAIDLDKDGVVACRPIPQPRLALPGLGWLRTHAPTLHGQVLANIDTLDTKLPAKALISYTIGQLECPELDELARLSRHFDFLFDEYDDATGDAVPAPAAHQPDGYITWNEFPHSDQDLPADLRSRGLAGPDAFRALDVNGTTSSAAGRSPSAPATCASTRRTSCATSTPTTTSASPAPNTPARRSSTSSTPAPTARAAT
jgi:hypothetical protein